jgi:uncharacterized protein YjbI with pentapeptide repeats
MSEEQFVDRDLHGARFEGVDLRGARFRMTNLTGATMRDVELVDVTVTGDVRNLVINEVDVAPLIGAELDRRDPDRVLMRPTDADGFRRAWEVVERRWAATVHRARGLDPELLHASVDGEWSFVQTLRHLVFATDVWVRRVVLGDPRPWDPLSLPFDGMRPDPEVPWDREARPSLDTVLALREDRTGTVRAFLADLTDERLDERTRPVEGPGWPPADSYPVRECLLVVLDEEWEHRRYAERDLAVLEGD